MSTATSALIIAIIALLLALRDRGRVDPDDGRVDELEDRMDAVEFGKLNDGPRAELESLMVQRLEDLASRLAVLEEAAELQARLDIARVAKEDPALLERAKQRLAEQKQQPKRS